MKTTSTNDERVSQQSIDEDEELMEMTRGHDAFGWKKVFVDMLGEIPIAIPLSTIGVYYFDAQCSINTKAFLAC